MKNIIIVCIVLLCSLAFGKDAAIVENNSNPSLDWQVEYQITKSEIAILKAFEKSEAMQSSAHNAESNSLLNETESHAELQETRDSVSNASLAILDNNELQSSKK